MAAHITPRAIVQYGSVLLTIVVVYNLGRHLRAGDGPSKAEQDIASMLSRQQRMDGDLKRLRNLMEDLRTDLKTARGAQADTVKAVREAAEQEASKQVAAVVSQLKSGQAALTKLGRVAEAQQQQIEAVQAKLHMAVHADSQHEAALLALREEHAKHLADSSRAERSVREQGANTAQQKQLGRKSSSNNSNGSSKELGRKQGAALLPKRGSSSDETSSGVSAGGGGSHLSIAQRAGLRSDVGATGISTSGSSQDGSQLGGAAQLDQHARQQVLAGRDPHRIVAAHQAGAPAAAPEDIAQDSAALLDAHAAVLAAKKAEHAERQQAGTGEAAGLAGGGGIAGAVSGMTANRPTGAPGAEEAAAPAAGALTGAELADPFQAVQDQAQLVTGAGTGDRALEREASSLRDAVAPASAAATAEVTARELVQALDQGAAASAAAPADGGSALGGGLADPAAARAVMLDAAKAARATQSAEPGSASAGGERIQDAAAKQRAAIMAAAGKAAHEQRLDALAGGGGSISGSRGSEDSSASGVDISGLQRAAAVRLGGGNDDIGSVFGSSGSGGPDSDTSSLGTGSSGSGAADSVSSSNDGDPASSGQSGNGAADPLEAFEAVLNSRADANPKIGTDGVARQ